MSKRPLSNASDSDRLKQINLELGGLKHRHNTCRINARFYGVLAAILITASTVGTVHKSLANDADWAKNPDSPVYHLATQEKPDSWLPMALIILGYLAGLGMIYKARNNCSSQRKLWDHESRLRVEMQKIRDKMYIRESVHTRQPQHRAHPPAHTQPLTPDEASKEYAGTYAPPPQD